MKRTHTKKKWLLPVVAAAAAVAGFFAVCGGNSPVQIARVLSATAQGEALVSSIVLDTAAVPQGSPTPRCRRPQVQKSHPAPLLLPPLPPPSAGF